MSKHVQHFPTFITTKIPSKQNVTYWKFWQCSIKSRPSFRRNWIKSLLKNLLIQFSLHVGCVMHAWPTVKLHKLQWVLLYEWEVFETLSNLYYTVQWMSSSTLHLTIKYPPIKIQNANFSNQEKNVFRQGLMKSSGTLRPCLHYNLKSCINTYLTNIKISKSKFQAIWINICQIGNSN